VLEEIKINILSVGVLAKRSVCLEGIVPTRSSGVMTCLASDYVGRAQQGTWIRER